MYGWGFCRLKWRGLLQVMFKSLRSQLKTHIFVPDPPFRVPLWGDGDAFAAAASRRKHSCHILPFQPIL